MFAWIRLLALLAFRQDFPGRPRFRIGSHQIACNQRAGPSARSSSFAAKLLAGGRVVGFWADAVPARLQDADAGIGTDESPIGAHRHRADALPPSLVVVE